MILKIGKSKYKINSPTFRPVLVYIFGDFTNRSKMRKEEF